MSISIALGDELKKLIERQIGPVKQVAKNVSQLAEYLSQQSDIENITYFCGNLRLDDLEDGLSKSKINLEEVIAYNTFSSPQEIKPDVEAVLFFSPSGIQSFMEKNEPNFVAFCIGETTAKEARKYFDKVEVAHMPSTESMLELVNAFFQ